MWDPEVWVGPYMQGQSTTAALIQAGYAGAEQR